MMTPEKWASLNCPHLKFVSYGECKNKHQCKHLVFYTNGNVKGCKLYMDYSEGADTQVNKSEKCCNCIHKPKCDFSAEMDAWRPNYSCKKFKHVNDKTVYIVEPLCHGNGGWCGTEIVAEYPSLEDALKSRPRVRLEYSPYGGDVMNEPRLSHTKNINDATHIFAYEGGWWEWKGLK